MRPSLHIHRRQDSSLLVLVIRWGVPLLFIIFGIVMILLAHGHLTGVQDNASESNVFSTSTFTDRDSMLSTIGVAAIVIAFMIMLLSWMLRLNSDEAGDRAKEDEAREVFRKTGHWPDEEA